MNRFIVLLHFWCEYVSEWISEQVFVCGILLFLCNINFFMHFFCIFLLLMILFKIFFFWGTGARPWIKHNFFLVIFVALENVIYKKCGNCYYYILNKLLPKATNRGNKKNLLFFARFVKETRKKFKHEIMNSQKN